MNKKNILILGSCCIDLFFKSHALSKRIKRDRLSLALGGKYLAEEFSQLFGGGGANSAISLARQNFQATLISKVGQNDFFSDLALRNLKKNLVLTDFATKTAINTQVSAIILTTDGEKTIINYRADADLVKLNPQIKEEMKKSEFFLIFSMARMPKAEKIKFLRFAKENNVKTFLSLHGEEYAKGLTYLKDYFSLADIVQMNAHECADIFGGNAQDFNFSKVDFARKLKIPLLLITYDVKGSFAYSHQKIYRQEIIKPKKIVDTTGAGDAFASGFLGEYLKTGEFKKALFFGAANASSVIEKLGAQDGLLFRK